MTEHLRPLERRVVAMAADGLSAAEIGERINRSAEHTARILEWADIPRSQAPTSRNPRAVERRVLDLRASGETHEQIAQRFKRSPRAIRQIEGLAHFRLALNLLEREETPV